MPPTFDKPKPPHGIWPSRLRYNTSTGEGELIVQQGKWNQYAVSQAGLEYLQRALKEQKVTQAYVVLKDRSGKQVARRHISEVVAGVEGIRPMNGRLGPYWWFFSDLTPNPPTDAVPSELWTRRQAEAWIAKLRHYKLKLTPEQAKAWTATLRAQGRLEPEPRPTTKRKREPDPNQLLLPFAGGLGIKLAPPKKIPDYLLHTCRPREKKEEEQK